MQLGRARPPGRTLLPQMGKRGNKNSTPLQGRTVCAPATPLRYLDCSQRSPELHTRLQKESPCPRQTEQIPSAVHTIPPGGCCRGAVGIHPLFQLPPCTFPCPKFGKVGKFTISFQIAPLAIETERGILSCRKIAKLRFLAWVTVSLRGLTSAPLR